MPTTGLSPHARIHSHRVPHALRAAALPGDRHAHSPPPQVVPGLRVRVLDMAKEQSLIMGLRQHAPMDAERDLDPGVDALESFKDRLGLVMAIRLDDELIATIRFIPFGHGVTLAEKRWAQVARSKAGFGARSWEVGRLIVAPVHRSMSLLRACLALAMQALLTATDAQHLHASCSPLLARLYRCFGFVTEQTVESDNGSQHVLIRASTSDVARALGVSQLRGAKAVHNSQRRAMKARRSSGARDQLYVSGCALPQNTRYM